ncbi:MAG: 3-deoxy-manno-octulosonate cytidylyltransferase [Pyrinomonadaceae bacterium]
MEQHGNNHPKNVIAIIPARFASTRLKGKLLLKLAGKPLILHTLEQAKRARNVSRVIVATDDEQIFQVVQTSGNEAVMTSPNHQSGSDRIAEVAMTLPENSIIVNVQGDEPLISPRTIEKTVDAILVDETVDISTASEKFETFEDLLNPNVVKAVTDASGFAMYFSRAVIPFPREAVMIAGSLESVRTPFLLSRYKKHVGIYAYRREFLLKFTRMEQTFLEKTEMLEQLRALENGAKIKIVEVDESSIGVDTLEDFERVRQILVSQTVTFREATIEDIQRIAKVHVESWQRSFAGLVPQEFLDNMSVAKRTEDFKKGFSQSSFYKLFIAETLVAGIVGFADFGKSRGRQSFDAELYALYLLPEFQKKGIGTGLFRLCQREMAASGFKSMFLDSLEISPYRKFYEKLGGRIVGEDKHDLAGTEYKTVIYGWSDLGNYE